MPRANGWPADRLAELVPRLYNVPGVNPDAETGGAPVHVEANHGRWVVHCPAPGCGGAQLGHPADRRFLCVECGNALNSGRYRPVIWPGDALEIAQLLTERADV